ncbi:MAG TPA: DUF1576 domain-containing protein [Clostridiales bacterium]|jgi:hypothetical protein|nr:DUF1576 domain-containing protein [Clostridiales bacterium]
MNKKSVFDTKYIFVVVFSIGQIIFGLTQNSIYEILTGMVSIITQPSSLVTDYIGLGNMGAAFVNSGLVTLICILLLYKLKQSLNGPFIAAIFTISGFALFGKNLFNVWFVLLGAYAYSRFKKDKFNKFLIPALFGTAIAPAVSEIAFGNTLPLTISLPLGMICGILLGFVIPPLGSSLINVHHGFNLYNIGFTAGMTGLIFVSIIRSFGYVPTSQFIWTSGNNVTLGIYIFGLFGIILITGFLLNGKSFKNYKNLLDYSGRLITDFVQLEGFPVSLINIGVTGIISTMYILLINGDLNGPTIGGIFTIAGFSAFGKHPKNILPVFLGVFIGSLLKVFAINDPAIQLAALFGTALAPIAGEYGWHWGVVAGFVHSSVVLNVGYLHGGLNLYNNGFAAGLAAAVLIPIIEMFGKDDDSK